jgi:diguanylate cyclase (GGDEF)-like protein
VLLVFLAMLPALALIVYSAAERRRAIAVEARDNVLRLTRLVSHSQEELIQDARHVLSVLARLPEVRRRDGPGCNALLAGLLKEYAGYTNFAAVGPGGDMFCSGVPFTAPVSVADRPWFRRVLETRGFVVSYVETGRISQRALLTFAYPALGADDQVSAVVVVGADIKWLNRIGMQASLPDEASLLMLDHSGTILVGYPEPETWVGKSAAGTAVGDAIRHRGGEGTVEGPGLDGVTRLYAFTPLSGIPDGGLYVAVGIPTALAFGDVTRAFARDVMALGVVAALALVAAWALGDVVLVRRVRALSEAAERLRAGDLTARADISGGDEISAMAGTFNATAERLARMVQVEQEARQVLAGRVEEMAQHARDVEVLRHMNDLVQACVSVDEAYTVIGRLAEKLFPHGAGALFALGPSRHLLEANATWGGYPADASAIFAPEECWGLRRGQVHVVDDLRSGTVCSHLPRPLPSGYICIPLMAQAETLGVIYLSGASAEAGGQCLTDNGRHLAETVAGQLSLSLANLKLRESLSNQSIRDHLTGLFNRRYLEETLERELRRAERARRSVAVILVDVDDFKLFNDTYGHAAGDAVLKRLGHLLSANSRGGDIACRFGGDEIVIVLPEASLENARRRAEQLRETARGLQLEHGGEALGSLTVSVGVAAFPDHGATSEALLRAADIALYRAKADGRDRVASAEE